MLPCGTTRFFLYANRSKTRQVPHPICGGTPSFCREIEVCINLPDVLEQMMVAKYIACQLVVQKHPVLWNESVLIIVALHKNRASVFHYGCESPVLVSIIAFEVTPVDCSLYHIRRTLCNCYGPLAFTVLVFIDLPALSHNVVGGITFGRPTTFSTTP